MYNPPITLLCRCNTEEAVDPPVPLPVPNEAQRDKHFHVRTDLSPCLAICVLRCECQANPSRRPHDLSPPPPHPHPSQHLERQTAVPYPGTASYATPSTWPRRSGMGSSEALRRRACGRQEDGISPRLQAVPGAPLTLSRLSPRRTCPIAPSTHYVISHSPLSFCAISLPPYSSAYPLPHGPAYPKPSCKSLASPNSQAVSIHRVISSAEPTQGYPSSLKALSRGHCEKEQGDHYPSEGTISAHHRRLGTGATRNAINHHRSRQSPPPDPALFVCLTSFHGSDLQPSPGQLILTYKSPRIKNEGNSIKQWRILGVEPAHLPSQGRVRSRSPALEGFALQYLVLSMSSSPTWPQGTSATAEVKGTANPLTARASRVGRSPKRKGQRNIRNQIIEASIFINTKPSIICHTCPSLSRHCGT